MPRVGAFSANRTDGLLLNMDDTADGPPSRAWSVSTPPDRFRLRRSSAFSRAAARPAQSGTTAVGVNPRSQSSRGRCSLVAKQLKLEAALKRRPKTFAECVALVDPSTMAATA